MQTLAVFSVVIIKGVFVCPVKPTVVCMLLTSVLLCFHADTVDCQQSHRLDVAVKHP